MNRVDLTANAWTATATIIDGCRRQLRECERAFEFERGDHGQYEPSERYEAETGYLGYLLRQAHLRMLLLIELADLPLYHTQYMLGIGRFGQSLDEVEQSSFDPESLNSRPLRYIDQSFDALSAMLRGPKDRDLSGLALFETVLRQAPHIIQDRGLIPTSEAMVRSALFDVLKVVFPDCRKEIPVSHIFKVYKADLGVSSIKALAEIKYAHTEFELRVQIGGVYEDVKGYNGDPQWNSFFALFYTTSPIASIERIEEEFKIANVDLNWIPIVVHGPGTRNIKPTKNKKLRSGLVPTR